MEKLENEQRHFRNVPELWKFCSHFSENHERIILTYVSISCFLHFPLLCFFFFDLEQTSLRLQLSLFQRSFTWVLRISPRSGMQWPQWSPCRGFVLNAALGRLLGLGCPGKQEPGAVAHWRRGAAPQQSTENSKNIPELFYFFSGQTILFSVMRLYTVHSVTVVYKHSYFHT